LIRQHSNAGSFVFAQLGKLGIECDAGGRLPDETIVLPGLLPKENFPGKYQNQTNEWIAAIRANKPDIAMSNFEYSAYFTEIILLGNLAMRVPGAEVKWDGPAMKSPNNSKANTFVSHPYRKGFELPSVGIS
jgi:hypothetical protein